MKRIILLFALISINIATWGQNITYQTRTDIPYYSESIRNRDAYINERCVLDIYYPENTKDFITIVWFHGGGMTGGSKFIPEELKGRGFCVVAVNYRLNPGVTCPKYIEDAAAAVAWVFGHIGQYGGNTNRIIVSGHSAGAYLTSMIGLDKRWLQKYNIDANQIAALFPLSGNTITHLTVRQEKGIPDTQPVVDQYAPLFHVRADAPPLFLMTGDRELEMLGRYEENAYLKRMMKIKGHQQTHLYEFEGYGHDMLAPAFPLMVKHIKEVCKEK